jgi:hypothetical protein
VAVCKGCAVAAGLAWQAEAAIAAASNRTIMDRLCRIILNSLAQATTSVVSHSLLEILCPSALAST